MYLKKYFLYNIMNEFDTIKYYLSLLNNMRYDKNLNVSYMRQTFQDLMKLLKFKKCNLPFNIIQNNFEGSEYAYLYSNNYKHITDEPEEYNYIKKELKKICKKINNYSYKTDGRFKYDETFLINYEHFINNEYNFFRILNL